MGVSLNLSTSAEVSLAIDHATEENLIRIATANPEFILDAREYPDFCTALANMSHVTIDGTGLFIALSLFSKQRPELYHGSDMVTDLLRTYQKGEKKFYFIGDKPGVAQTAAETIQKMYPEISIVGAEDGGWIDKNNVKVDPELTERILSADTDILLVGYGAPKQELWIHATSRLPIPVMIGVGGSFGFFGTKKRAPTFIKVTHLEWLYRAITEKGHWKRSFRAFAVFAPFSFLYWLCSPLRKKTT